MQQNIRRQNGVWRERWGDRLGEVRDVEVNDVDKAENRIGTLSPSGISERFYAFH